MNIVQDKNMLPDDQWIDVCALDDLTPNTGAGALVGGQAVAIFRVGHEKRVYVLSNKDPFSQANVMSRGLLVIYKANASLHHQFINNISV